MIYIGNDTKKSGLLFGIILLVIGLIIFSNPFGTLELLISIVAWGILLYGIVNLASYRYLRNHNSKQPFLFLQGLLSAVFAIIIIAMSNIAVLAIMAIAGIYVIILSMLKIVQAFKLKNYQIVGWEIKLVMGIIGLFFGACLLMFPEIFPMLLGTVLVIIGSIICFTSLKNK